MWLLNKKVIVFAPHPDDETYGCGGTIAKRISEGHEVIVVVMTDGRNLFRNSLGIEFGPSPEEVREMRGEEVIRATRILGVPKKNLLFLDFEDGTLEEHKEEAEGRVIEIIKNYPPAEVYFPYTNDCHPDHQATSQIVRKCLRELGLTPRKYQYSILHKYARVGPLMERLLSLFKGNMVEVDISEFLNLKEKAVRMFKSEISIISSKQEKPLEEKVKKYLRKQETFHVDK